MNFRAHSSKVALVASLGLALSAQAADAPKRIDVKELSKKVEDVVVPLPNEVFGALNKLGSVNWKEYVRNDKVTISRRGRESPCFWEL